MSFTLRPPAPSVPPDRFESHLSLESPVLPSPQRWGVDSLLPRAPRVPGASMSPPPRLSLAPEAGESDPPVSMSPPSRVSVPPPSLGSMAPPSRRSFFPPALAETLRKSVPPPAAFAIAVATLTPACAVATTPSEAPSEGSPVSLSQLNVTHGSVEQGAPGHLEIANPKVRAVASGGSGDGAELRFTYRGPTDVTAPLDSGQLRRQLGIKLHAQDGCNLVYVVWRIEPTPELVVSVKRNPGESNHDECGARGYHTIAPEFSLPMPKLAKGNSHALSAAIENNRLLVRVDGAVVWEGDLGEDARDLAGPVGFRSDNGQFSLELVPMAPSAVVGASWNPPQDG